MAMVSNKFLGALSVKLGFHKHLRLLSSSHIHLIQEYVTEITDADAESHGARDYWTTTKNPPKVSALDLPTYEQETNDPRKCLPDIVESYIGAIFVDSKFDYKEVERFFEAHVRWYFEDMSIYDTFANCHPTVSLPPPPRKTSTDKTNSPTDLPEQPPNSQLRLHELPPHVGRAPHHRRRRPDPRDRRRHDPRPSYHGRLGRVEQVREAARQLQGLGAALGACAF